MFQIWSWYEKNLSSCDISFRALYHKQLPGAIQTLLKNFMHFSVTNVYIYLSILLLSQNPEIQTFPIMFFGQIIKRFVSKRP